MQNKEVAYSIYSLGNKFEDGFIEQYKLLYGITFSKVKIKLTSLDFGIFINEDLKAIDNKKYLLFIVCNEFGLDFANEDGSITNIGSGEIYPIYIAGNQIKNNMNFLGGQYEGINILIDIEKFLKGVYSSKSKKEAFSILFENKFSESAFEKLIFKLNKGFEKRNFLISNFRKENPFKYMSNIDKHDFVNMADIKFLELFTHISNMKVFSYKKESIYFYKEQIEKVKQAQYKLINNLDRHITIMELAEEFNISATALKAGFKFVYGKPIDTYIREYKMYKACGLLKTTNYTIAFIAETLGYESAGKFSAAFKKIIKVSPSKYRRN